MIKLKVNCKKFTSKNNEVFYSLSTKLEKQDGTTEWYKVVFTNDYKQDLEKAKVKLNRPFELTINENYLGYDETAKKVFVRKGEEPSYITFIKSEDKEKESMPKFNEVFKTECVDLHTKK